MYGAQGGGFISIWFQTPTRQTICGCDKSQTAVASRSTLHATGQTRPTITRQRLRTIVYWSIQSKTGTNRPIFLNCIALVHMRLIKDRSFQSAMILITHRTFQTSRQRPQTGLTHFCDSRNSNHSQSPNGPYILYRLSVANCLTGKVIQCMWLSVS